MYGLIPFHIKGFCYTEGGTIRYQEVTLAVSEPVGGRWLEALPVAALLLDRYILERSHALFTHTLCPRCTGEYYREMEEMEEEGPPGKG